ncbi:MAG: helix-turn-helix domain-containing protein [Phycisphaeraceae bacterium]
MPKPALIDVKAAMQLLSLGRRTLWSLTNRNAVPHRRIGRAVRYCPRELEAWIQAGCPTEPDAARKIRSRTLTGVGR